MSSRVEPTRRNIPRCVISASLCEAMMQGGCLAEPVCTGSARPHIPAVGARWTS